MPPIFSANGDTHGENPKKRFLAITFDWSALFMLFSGKDHLAMFFLHMPICLYAHIWPNMGIWAWKKTRPTGVSLKRELKMPHAQP